MFLKICDISWIIGVILYCYHSVYGPHLVDYMLPCSVCSCCIPNAGPIWSFLIVTVYTSRLYATMQFYGPHLLVYTTVSGSPNLANLVFWLCFWFLTMFPLYLIKEDHKIVPFI